MKIHTLFSPQNVDELYFTGKVTVVIDVLRATTTINAALENGAKEIIPVDTVDFAVKVSGSAFGGQTLLAGERNTHKVEGFALGNSPLEFTEELIKGKSIILYTSNGSKAIIKAKFSEHLFTASFNNLESLVELILALDRDVEILCSGANGQFCIEDAVCAGKLIAELMKRREDIEFSDASSAALSLAKSFGKNIKKMLYTCEHGKLLIENGFEDDLVFASKLNSSKIIPYFSENVIKPVSAELVPEIEKMDLGE